MLSLLMAWPFLVLFLLNHVIVLFVHRQYNWKLHQYRSKVRQCGLEPLNWTVNSSSVPGFDPYNFNLNYIFLIHFRRPTHISGYIGHSSGNIRHCEDPDTFKKTCDRHCFGYHISWYEGFTDQASVQDEPVLISGSLPGTTSAKHDIVKEIGAALTTAKVT